MKQETLQKRQLSFSETKCSLCNVENLYLSIPSHWINKRTHDPMHGINNDQLVCKTCRNDITKLLADKNYIPRCKKSARPLRKNNAVWQIVL